MPAGGHQRYWTESGVQQLEAMEATNARGGGGPIIRPLPASENATRRSLPDDHSPRSFQHPPLLHHAATAPQPVTSPSGDSPYDGMLEEGEEILAHADPSPTSADAPRFSLVPPTLSASHSLPVGLGIVSPTSAARSEADQPEEDAFSGLMSGKLAEGSDSEDEGNQSSEEAESEDEGTNVLFVTKPKPKQPPANASTSSPALTSAPPPPPPPPLPPRVAALTSARSSLGGPDLDIDDTSSTIREGAQFAQLFDKLSVSMSDSEGSTIIPNRPPTISTPTPIQSAGHTRPSNRSLPPIITNPTSTPANPSPALPHSLSHQLSTSSGEDLLNSAPFSSTDELDPSSHSFLEGGARPNSDLSRSSGPTSNKTPLHRRKTVFAQNADQQWAFRPPPEIVVKQLHKFFPKVNLEAEVIATNISNDSNSTITPQSSLAASSSAASSSSSRPSSPDSLASAKLRNRKSIRRVVEDRQLSIDGVEKPPERDASPMYLASPAHAEQSVKVMRRRSTKMWGSKVEEVRPGELKKDVEVPAIVQEVTDEAADEPGKLLLLALLDHRFTTLIECFVR
jgi:hypothetical protein